MLDLFISYINFFIIAIDYIIKFLTFQPPTPPGYIIEKTRNKKEIFFIIENEKHISYERKVFKDINIEYIYLNNDKLIKSEFLILKPKNNYPICIIYCHGNCGDLGYALYDSYQLAKYTNCLILCFEYPGYGTFKKTKITENNLYISIQKAYLYAKNKLHFSEKNIILCKKNFPVGGLILQSPYLSIMRIIYNIKKTFFLDIFPNCDKVKNIKTKTLFIHGTEDQVIPYIHGRILAKLIPEKYLYQFLTIRNGDHNNLLIDNKEKEIIFEKIKEFIADCSGCDIKINTDMSEANDKRNSFSNDEISYEVKSQNTLDRSILTENKFNKRKFMVHNKKIKSDINFCYKEDSVVKFENNNSNNSEAMSIDNLFEKEKKGLKNTLENNKERNEKFFGNKKLKDKINKENNFLNKSFSMFNITNKYYNEEIDKLKYKK